MQSKVGTGGVSPQSNVNTFFNSFDAALRRAASRSDWFSWLVRDEQDAARSTLRFLDTCFTNVPAAKHPRIIKRLAGDCSQLEATIDELVAHELLRRLKLSPEFEPQIAGLTPDLSFKIAGKRFLGDVYVTHSPLKTIRDFDDGTGEAWDTSRPDESRANKIANELAYKAKSMSQPDCLLLLSSFLATTEFLERVT